MKTKNIIICDKGLINLEDLGLDDDTLKELLIIAKSEQIELDDLIAEALRCKIEKIKEKNFNIGLLNPALTKRTTTTLDTKNGIQTETVEEYERA